MINETLSEERATTRNACKGEAIGLKKPNCVGAMIGAAGRASDLVKQRGIGGPGIIENYMTYLDDPGHKRPYRYEFKKLVN